MTEGPERFSGHMPPEETGEIDIEELDLTSLYRFRELISQAAAAHAGQIQIELGSPRELSDIPEVDKQVHAYLIAKLRESRFGSHLEEATRLRQLADEIDRRIVLKERQLGTEL